MCIEAYGDDRDPVANAQDAYCLLNLMTWVLCVLFVGVGFKDPAYSYALDEPCTHDNVALYVVLDDVKEYPSHVGSEYS